MLMATPKSLIFALYSHWEVIENMVVAGREFPSFEQEQVVTLISRCNPQKNRDECEEMLRKMVGQDLLQVMPRGEALQIHPLVLEFVRGLTREHELGLSEVLKVRIDAIKGATTKLIDGLQSNDTDQLRQAATQLAELFRQIGRQLDQDRHAILELAERAKSKDANLPITRRYGEVLSAYDNYVAPMAEMMDSGPSGTFYRHLEAAEHALDHAVETLTIQGALYSQRISMRQVAFQAKELRRLGREVLKQCSDTLLPLREDIRQHNVLSSSISQILGKIRKRGLNATLVASKLPLWKRDMPRRVTVGSDVLAIMVEAMNYQPASMFFPEDENAEAPMALDLIDESALYIQLRQSLPVDDLLSWLHERYPDFGDATVLRLYHALADHQDWSIKAADSMVAQSLKTVQVTYYPHALSAASNEESMVNL